MMTINMKFRTFFYIAFINTYSFNINKKNFLRSFNFLPLIRIKFFQNKVYEKLSERRNLILIFQK